MFTPGEILSGKCLKICSTTCVSLFGNVPFINLTFVTSDLV